MMLSEDSHQSHTPVCVAEPGNGVVMQYSVCSKSLDMADGRKMFFAFGSWHYIYIYIYIALTLKYYETVLEFSLTLSVSGSSADLTVPCVWAGF